MKMVQSQFSLCWDSYKNNICSGFSALQQNGEFVDMTLAADGHYVKVHQILLAMASPYLKELITSVPCQHPVIFLNNVSYRTLCLLLEYIYTGEVIVQADILTAFAESAKALHIKGIENITSNNNLKNVCVTKANDNESSHIRTNKLLAGVPTEITGQVKLPARAKKIYIKHENAPTSTVNSATISPTASKIEIPSYTDVMEDSEAQDDDNTFIEEHNLNMETAEMDSVLTKDTLPTSTKLQFTVSIRGSLQMILNRYIYNLNSTTTRTGVKRWRCVDYRNNKCSAFVVTKGNVVLNRANLHNHPYHDKKILTKIEKKAVFSALDEIEAYKEKEARINSENFDMSMDHENFLSLDEFSSEIDVKNDSVVKNT